MVCDSTNALREGRSPSERDVAPSLAAHHQGRQAARGGHHLRLQRRAHPRRGRRRRGGRARIWWSRGGPCTASSRWRWRRATCRGLQVSRPGALLVSASRDEVVVLLHRQPGRAARGAGAHRRGRASATSSSARAISSSSPRAPSPATSGRSGRIQNQLVDLGCELVTDGDALVHVTGHPRREELKEMYGWVRPRDRHPHARRGAASGRARQARARRGRRARC